MRARGISNTQKGFVLLLTLMLMVSMGAISGGLAIYLSHDLRDLSIQTNNAKAFWIAEAGIADAIKRLKNSEITVVDGASNTSAMLDVSFAGGAYSVSVTRSGSDYTLVSTGTYNSQTRRVESVQSALFPTAFNYGVFGNNSNNATFRVGNNNAATVSIYGDLFYNATAGTDTVNVFNNSRVAAGTGSSGLIYADTVTGGGTYTKASSNPNPVPTYPTFSSTTYDNAVTTSAGFATNYTLSGSGNLNLAGQTLYYNRVIIRDNATVTGPGTIVADTTVLLRDNAAIGSDVTIIAGGNITTQNQANTGSGGVMYSQSNIILQNTSVIRGALISPSNDVRVQDDVTFTGIIYANQAQIVNNAIINGSVVANRFTNNQIANNATITWDSSYIPSTLPTGFSSNSFTQKANSWKET